MRDDKEEREGERVGEGGQSERTRAEEKERAKGILGN